MWTELIVQHGATQLAALHSDPAAVRTLLMLFAISDETCSGMGWDGGIGTSIFTAVVLLNLAGSATDPIRLQYLPRSLCGMVSPDAAVVLPKSITSSVGCTIRSLSHYFALLPPKTLLPDMEAGQPSLRTRQHGYRLDKHGSNPSCHLNFLLTWPAATCFLKNGR